MTRYNFSRIKDGAMVYLILFLVSFLLAECGPSMPVNTVVAPDKEILLNPTCTLPCWEGIIPGHSNKNTFVNLMTRRFRPPGSLEEYKRGSGIVIGSNYSNLPDKSILAYIQDDIIQAIDLDATSGITMGNVIEKLGAPAKIQTSAVGQHIAGYDVRIFYPQHGLVIHFAQSDYLSKDYHARIHPQLIVDEISLFPAGSIEDIFSIVRKFNGGTVVTPMHQVPLQDWRGYGDYEILPPLPTP
jgi:hypothetical protein